MKNVEQVAVFGLCTGCGTCAGVCPQESIRMYKKKADQHYLPEINENKCTSCGLCIKVCPGYNVDFIKLNSQVFGCQPSDSTLGNNLGCYIGYSNDPDLRLNCASGGIASQILISSLKSGLINGALLIKLKNGYPLETEATIVTTAEQVLSNSGSKYFPAAVNDGLKYIMNTKGKFAIVGLPCHIHGVRKAESIFKSLKEKIVLHIGLVCSHTVNFDGTDFILEKLGVTKHCVEKIDYRGKGWPGLMSIESKNSKIKTFPYVGGWNSYWPVFSSFFFSPFRCMMCPDVFNELADISLGDAWFPELVKKDSFGYSLIVARNEIGKNVLDSLSSSGEISLKSINPVDAKRSQREPIKFKKFDFHDRMKMLESFGKTIPDFKLNHVNVNKLGIIAWLRSFFGYINNKLSSWKLFRSFLVKIPFPVFRLYYGFLKILFEMSRSCV